MAMKRKALRKNYVSLTENEPFTGKFLGVETLTRADGTPVISGMTNQPLQVALFESKQADGVWLDGGLKGSLALCKVQPGMTIELVKKGKKPFGDFEVNDYDVFELTEE